MTRASNRALAELESRGFNVIQNGYIDVLESGEDLEFDGFDPKPKKQKLDLTPDNL